MIASPPGFARRGLRPLSGAAALLIVAALPRLAIAEAPGADQLGLVNKGLVAVAQMPADRRDRFGETTINGSGMAVDLQSWTRTEQGYRGLVYLLPDRGWNTTGTIDYRPRLHKMSVAISPAAAGTKPGPAVAETVEMTLTDTILLTDPDGQPLTGLDPIGVRPAAAGFPDLPQAANGHISLDPEAVVLLSDGGFFISDEYGPYIYRFSAAGRLVGAIRPPEAFIPQRQGRQNFSSNNPGPGAAAPVPPDPETGRQNNQGFEGMALSSDGRTLAVILQSATRQDGGASPATRRYTRMLFYDVADLEHPRLVREHVVPLPVFQTADNKRRVAAQSELLALGAHHFLLLCRDGGNGYGLPSAASLYRRIELLDTSQASNIAGSPYDATTPVAPEGKLADGITPATLSPFIDLNDNAELGRFGLHNGEPNDRTNLSEKWEGMGLAPAFDPANPRDFFLLVSNDNDFITQNGFQAGAAYKDPSGVDIATMLLVYRVRLPEFGK